MKRFYALMLLVLYGAVYSAPARAIIIRHDVPEERYLELGRQFSFIVHLNLPRGEATLIAPRWVLTAAHAARALKPGHGLTIGGKLYPVETVVLHPQWQGMGYSEHDIALVKLAGDVSEVPPVRLYREKDEVGKLVTIAGAGFFGTGQTGPQDKYGSLHAATNIIDAATDELIKFRFDAPGSKGVTPLEGVSGPGDSGGPAFIKRGGTLYLAGVSSDQERGGPGWREGVYGVTEKYVRVSSYLGWIENTMRTEAGARFSRGELPRRGFIGVQLDTIPEAQRAQAGPAGAGGLLVAAVVPGGSAEAAGIAKGDVITKLGSWPLSSPGEFVRLVGRYLAGESFQLTVLRDGKEQVKTLVVKPRPPETSAEFDILYKSVEAGGGRRRVILTKPKGEGKHPAVLLVGGIGCYSLDNLAPDNAYAKLLYGLTQRGFVTARVEKSGMGDSEGAPCTSPQVDFQAEVGGYLAGLRALKSYDFVDAGKVFILGHSIGGIVGPAVASQERVSGLIVAETVGTNWFEYALENFRRQAVMQNDPYDEAERKARLHRACKQRVWVDKQSPEQAVKDQPACRDFVDDPAPHTYMQQLVELNLAEVWKKVEAPVLVIYGSSDFLTTAAEHEYLKNMINSFHPGKAAYAQIEGMDHSFERAASQRESMERRRARQPPPAEFHSGVFDEIARWLDNALRAEKKATAQHKRFFRE